MTESDDFWELAARKPTPEENKAFFESESMKRWLADFEDEKRAKEARDTFVKHLMACADEKAFVGYDEDNRFGFLIVIEMAIRLAHNCAKNYEGVMGFRSMLEDKFIKALQTAISTNPFLFEKCVATEVAKAKKKKRAVRKTSKPIG